jgi:hypothetical protein
MAVLQDMTRSRPDARLNAAEACTQMSAAIEATPRTIKDTEVPPSLLGGFDEVPPRMSLYVYGCSPYWLMYIPIIAQMHDHQIVMCCYNALFRFQNNHPMLIIDRKQFNWVTPELNFGTLTFIFSPNWLTLICNVQLYLKICSEWFLGGCSGGPASQPQHDPGSHNSFTSASKIVAITYAVGPNTGR